VGPAARAVREGSLSSWGYSLSVGALRGQSALTEPCCHVRADDPLGTVDFGSVDVQAVRYHDADQDQAHDALDAIHG